MRLNDILARIIADIAQNTTPALDVYVAAVQSSDSAGQLAAWNALSEQEQTTVRHAYIRGTRMEVANARRRYQRHKAKVIIW